MVAELITWRKVPKGDFAGNKNPNSLYHSMQKLHEKLDDLGMKLLCNCFRIDMKPSGMGISMGSGRLAYKLELGKQAVELFDIFDPVEDVNLIASRKEQKEYSAKWFDSL
jgi:hypothetical protein